jgi:hypothetical protein
MAQMQVGGESFEFFQVAACENEAVLVRRKFRGQGPADPRIGTQD